jgi:hypothetical protein
MPVFISGKLKDYLCTNIPILSITPSNSPSRYLLENLKTVEVVSNDKDSIINAILKIAQTEYCEEDYKERVEIMKPFVVKNIVDEIERKFIETSKK